MTDASNERIVLLLVQLSIAVHDVFGVTPTKVQFQTLEKGRSFSLPVPPVIVAAPPLAGGALDVPSITRMERRILEIVGKPNANSGDPTGPEIAAGVKLECDQNFRNILSGMRKKGLLGGSTGQQGYPLTVVGYEIIHPENDEN